MHGNRNHQRTVNRDKRFLWYGSLKSNYLRCTIEITMHQHVIWLPNDCFTSQYLSPYFVSKFES